MMRILFMGTPSFASAALETIYESKFGAGIIGVVTKPDTQKDRGHKVLPSDVKIAAERLGIPVYQPETLKDGAFKETLDALAPDIIVVAAYGKILPGYVLFAPKYGCINIHGSMLPKYRGAAPIQRAILDGEDEIGVTIMQMNEGLDTGDMIISRAMKFTDEPFGIIYDALAKLGGEMAVEALSLIEQGKATPKKQDDSRSTYAPKIEKAECAIDFSLPAVKINNKIRALSPAPGAMARLGGKTVKIISAAVLDGCDGEIGQIVAASPKGDGYIDVITGDGVLRITRLVPEGKREMSAGDFVRGRGCAVGDKFE
ncbi:MAG: methionyl-tRNA formyltransferase [Clostridia bacterium]|nr:methionyl-tRNA formyltransferase [Clostridia bacterium]